jgi:hypothetical protein
MRAALCGSILLLPRPAFLSVAAILFLVISRHTWRGTRHAGPETGPLARWVSTVRLRDPRTHRVWRSRLARRLENTLITATTSPARKMLLRNCDDSDAPHASKPLGIEGYRSANGPPGRGESAMSICWK